MDIFNKEKVKQLEALITSHTKIWKEHNDKLKYELSILTEELDTLQTKLTEYEEAETKQLSFPSKKFNIKKAVELLTKDLSPKALAKFCHDFVEELGNSKYSHLISLNTYCLSKLSRTNK